MLDKIFNEIKQYNSYITESELKKFIDLLLQNDSPESIALKLGITKNTVLFIMSNVIYKSNLVMMLMESQQIYYTQFAIEALRDKGDSDWYHDTTPQGHIQTKPNIVQLKRDEMRVKFALHRLNAIDNIKKEVFIKKLTNESVDAPQNLYIEVEAYHPDED